MKKYEIKVEIVLEHLDCSFQQARTFVAIDFFMSSPFHNKKPIKSVIHRQNNI